jgi:hypothetical protein
MIEISQTKMQNKEDNKMQQFKTLNSKMFETEKMNIIHVIEYKT